MSFVIDFNDFWLQDAEKQRGGGCGDSQSIKTKQQASTL